MRLGETTSEQPSPKIKNLCAVLYAGNKNAGNRPNSVVRAADGTGDGRNGIHVAPDTQGTVNRRHIVVRVPQESIERCQHRRFGQSWDTKAGDLWRVADLDDGCQRCCLVEVKPVTELM